MTNTPAGQKTADGLFFFFLYFCLLLAHWEIAKSFYLSDRNERGEKVRLARRRWARMMDRSRGNPKPGAVVGHGSDVENKDATRKCNNNPEDCANWPSPWGIAQSAGRRGNKKRNKVFFFFFLRTAEERERASQGFFQQLETHTRQQSTTHSLKKIQKNFPANFNQTFTAGRALWPLIFLLLRSRGFILSSSPGPATNPFCPVIDG